MSSSKQHRPGIPANGPASSRRLRSFPEVDTVLVNRFYLRGVEQIDKRTGLKPQKLPGAPLGGITWQDRS